MAVFFAAALLIFIGMTGLAVDYGFGVLERRVLQNAVDAAAQTGASDLSRGVSPVSDVQTIATKNNISVGTTVICEYIDNANAVTGPCSGTPSGTTSGVKVTATSNRATYFMRVLGVPTVTVSANSMARVFAWSQSSSLTLNASNTLFLVCGIQTRRPTSPASYMNILDPATGYTTLRTDHYTNVVGTTFLIHGPQVADCGIHDSAFKGLNSSTGNLSFPGAIYTESGTRAGPVNQAIPTPGGCAGGLYSDDAALNNCKMYIPIFNHENMVKIGDDWRVNGVLWLPFSVQRTGANEHTGTLLADMPLLTNPDTILAPWTKNTRSIFTATRTVQ